MADCCCAEGVNAGKTFLKTSCDCNGGYEGEKYWENTNQPETQCYTVQAQPYRPKIRSESSEFLPTWGCGRENCTRDVYLFPAVEWEYTNYNRNGCPWPLSYVGKEDTKFQNNYYVNNCNKNRYEDSTIDQDFQGLEDHYSPYEGNCNDYDKYSKMITNNFPNIEVEEFEFDGSTEPEIEDYCPWCGKPSADYYEPDVDRFD